MKLNFDYKLDSSNRKRLPTASCKFLTEEITSAQNFNFAPKFPQNGRASA